MMERRFRRDRSHSYSKSNREYNPNVIHSHSVQDERTDIHPRHYSDSRPPGRAPALHAQKFPAIGETHAYQQPDPSRQEGAFSAVIGHSQGKSKAQPPDKGVLKPHSQPAPIQQNGANAAPHHAPDDVKNPLLTTRTRRWDQRAEEKFKDLHSRSASNQQPGDLAKTESTLLSETHSKSLLSAKSTPSPGTGQKIPFGTPSSKAKNTGKLQKGLFHKKANALVRAMSALSMVTSAQRETREDAATQDTGIQAARANGTAVNLAAQNVRRMTRQIRTRQYEKAAEKTAKGAVSAARGIKGLAQKVRYFFQAVFKGSRIGLIVLSAIAVLLVVIIVTMSVLSLLFSGAAAGVNGATMPASDAALDQAEAYYCAKENALQTEIEDAQQSHPGYNEYQYQIGGIGHNPVALVAYLSAMYGDFTFDSVKSALDDLFNQQYQLSYPSTSQIRTQTVTVNDPATGQTTTQQQQYTYTILTVKLVSQDFTAMVTPILQRAGKLDVYTVYLQNHGNRMYFSNPFAFAWDVYMTLQSDNSASVDVPEGTDVKASLGGVVTKADDGTVVITGTDGLSVTYWNCSNIHVSAGQSVNSGDVIAQTGSGFKLLFVHNGEHLNPFIFSDTGASSDSSGSDSSPISIGGQPIGGSVEAYRATVTQLAPQYGMGDYVNLILAVMEQESGGRGSDPMQAAEGPFNTRYPKCPNGITDPLYSIQCGIQELHQNLQLAGCTGPNDAADIALALQGYNFGSGFISWARGHGGYSLTNAQAFAQMEAAEMGWSSYGDPNYVPHVLRYYKQ